MQKKGQSFEYMRKYAHLRLRTNTFGAVFRIRHNMAMAIHQYFHEHGFYYFHTPLITGSDAEGAGNMFQVTTLDLDRVAKSNEVDYSADFFGKKRISLFLDNWRASSEQHHLEPSIHLVLHSAQKTLIHQDT